MSIYEELTDQPLNVLINFWFGEPPVEAEYADSFFEETAYEISRHGAEGGAFLAGQMQVEGQTRCRCLIGGLTVSDLPDEQKKKLIRPFLNSDSPDEQAEAISSFSYFRDPTVRDVILPRLFDQDVRLRANALQYMGKVFPTDSLGLILARLDDPEWQIRRQAVDEIDELDDQELSASFMDRIWPLMDDPHPVVRWGANWYLMTRLWWEADVPDIRQQIALETDPRRIATLIRFAGDQRFLDIVLDHIKDHRPGVRLAAIDELTEPWGSVLAALERDPEFFEKCANDSDQRVRDMVPELEEQLRFELRQETKE